jgi:hypothetical protein
MTNKELENLLRDKSEEWRAGFFAAVNLTNESKAAFLLAFRGEAVRLVATRSGEDSPTILPQRADPKPDGY